MHIFLAHQANVGDGGEGGCLCLFTRTKNSTRGPRVTSAAPTKQGGLVACTPGREIWLKASATVLDSAGRWPTEKRRSALATWSASSRDRPLSLPLALPDKARLRLARLSPKKLNPSAKGAHRTMARTNLNGKRAKTCLSGDRPFFRTNLAKPART